MNQPKIPLRFFTCTLALLIQVMMAGNSHAIDETDLAEAIGVESFEGYDAVPVSAVDIPYGDVNTDGQIDIVDALLTAQYYVHLENLPTVYGINADVSGNGVIDIVDALIIAQYYVGLISDFPVATTNHVFADAAIEEAVRETLNLDAAEPISEDALRHITALSIECSVEEETVDLADIKHLMALGTLSIRNCKIDDMLPIATLAENQMTLTMEPSTRPDWAPVMTTLELFNTGISDISAVGGFRALSSLDLSWNSIADISPLSSLASLEHLDLQMNLNVKTAYLANLTALRELDLGWTVEPDLSYLSDLSNLEFLDIRGTNVQDTDALDGLTNLVLLSLGRELVYCAPGDIIGDLDGDDAVTQHDVKLLNKLLLKRSRPFGAPLASDAVDCIDIDEDGNIDIDDYDMLQLVAEGSLDSPGRMGLDCPAFALRGDLDGDGEITDFDVEIAELIMQEAITLEGDCCMDVDNNGQITLQDKIHIEQMAASGDANMGSCVEDDGNIGIVTYRLDMNSLDDDREIFGNIDLEVIEAHHERVMSNGMLDHTDIIVFPEYAYANVDNPVAVQFNIVDPSNETAC